MVERFVLFQGWLFTGVLETDYMESKLIVLKVDTRYVTIPDSLDLFPGDLDDDIVSTGLKPKTNEELGLEDFYTIHLWNYCSGDYVEDGGKNKWKTTECTKPSAKYHFDIIEIFQIEAKENGGSGIDDEDLPDSVVKVNKAIKTVSGVMIGMYACGILTTFVTFLVGWFGLLSRWGSCVTTIFADVSHPIPPDARRTRCSSRIGPID